MSVLLLGALIIENARERIASIPSTTISGWHLLSGHRRGAFSCAQKWRETQERTRAYKARGTKTASVNFGGAPETPMEWVRRVFPALPRHFWRFWRIRLSQGIIKLFLGRSLGCLGRLRLSGTRPILQAFCVSKNACF